MGRQQKEDIIIDRKIILKFNSENGLRRCEMDWHSSGKILTITFQVMNLQILDHQKIC
jgi:hypothetical protein